MKKLLLLPSFLCVLTVSFAASSSAQVVDAGSNWKFPAIAHKSNVYIGTSSGLVIYDPEVDIWTEMYTGTTPGGNSVNVLGIDEEILWAGTDSGISTSDLRVGDMVVYSRKDGLPSDTVKALGFESDYVWAGTPAGAARFDKLTGTWDYYGTAEGLAGPVVNDIRVVDETIWFATDRGASEYDTEQETWRTHRPGTDNLFDSGFVKIRHSGRHIWFLAAEGAARYDTRTRSWVTYPGSASESWQAGFLPSCVLSEGDSLWVVVGGRILLFDPNLDAFSEFEHMDGLRGREVRHVALSGTDLWAATDGEIGRFERAVRTWKFYGDAQGLTTEGFLVVFASGSILHAFAEDGSINSFKLLEGRWYKTMPPPPLAERGESAITFVADERGTGLALKPGHELLIKGNTTWTWLREETADWSDPQGRSDLTLSGRTFGGRTLAGRYDNTDLEKTVYGVKFRGADRDVVEEVSLGLDRCEFGKDRLVRSFELRGASVRVGYGETESGNKRVGAAARSGERRSGFDTDFFVGKRRDIQIEVRDIDYVGNTFFLLDTLENVAGDVVIDDSETLYLDDGRAETNTANTILDTTIAGVDGDFDRLYPLADYTLDGCSGVVRLTAPVDSLSTVAAKYTSHSGQIELIIHSDSVEEYELVNRYSIGLNIIPRSLSLRMTDTLGQSHDLSEFGLDSNLDGRVDPDLVDAKSGILRFPERNPFPPEVYSEGTHIYSLQVSHSTTSPTYSLSHRRIVRLSETVRLDGAILERGDDYVVDNTNGTLVILREELVGDNSMLEISYEYEKDSADDFHLLDLRFDPSSSIRLNARGMRFDDDERGVEASDLIQGSAEVRTEVLGFDLRIPVELARTVSDTLNGTAQRYSFYAAKPDLFVSLGYRSYGSEFLSFSQEKGRYGYVRSGYGFNSAYYIQDWLLGEASLESKVFSADSSQSDATLEDGRAGLTLVHQRLPAVSLWLSGVNGKTGSFDERLRKLGSDLSYTVSREDFSRLPVLSLALQASSGRTWWREAAGDSSGSYDGGSFEVVSAVVRGVSVGCEYLWGYGEQDSVGETGERAEVRLSSSIDRIPGIALYGKTERRADEFPYGVGSDGRDASTDWRDYGRAGISPGVWFAALSFLDLEYEVSDQTSRDLRSVPSGLSFAGRFFDSSGLPAVGESSSRVQNFKSFVRPHLSLLLNLGYERTRDMDRVIDSGNTTSRDRYTARAEYRPRYRSTVTLYYDDTFDRRGPIEKSRTISPSVWWEEGWGDWVFTKTTVSYVSREESLGLIGTRVTSIVPQVSTTFRFRELGALGDIEFTTDASVRRTYVSNDTPSDPTVYATSFQVDLKPPRFLRLKSEFDLSRGRETTATALLSISGTF
jgi:hypothetical protein